MYYYIFEPSQNPKEQRIQEEIKALLQSRSIVGEFVTLSLAEEPQDLARVGLRKNYSTVVACGSDTLINEIGAGIVGTEAVLGVIPIEEKSIFHQILGTEDYLDACTILPSRKVLNIDTGLINQEKIFVSQVAVKPRKELISSEGLVIVSFDGDFQAETKLCNITISNVGIKKKSVKKIRVATTDHHLDVFIPDQLHKKEGFFSRIFSSGSKNEMPKTGSVFHPKKITIESRKKLVTMLGNKEIARGNITVESYPSSLNVIVKRMRPKVTTETRNS